MTLFEAYTVAKAQIDRLDARLLLEYATGCSHTDLLARPETPVIAPAYAQFAEWVARRVAGEPLAYLVGEAGFRGRVFQVSPAVLIPRPETEVLIELALEKLQGLERGQRLEGLPRLDAPRVLDLGTGSGIVAISLALEYPSARVTAVDISVEAIRVAENNTGRLGAEIRFCQSDWFESLPAERFDLIVSNPPYVADGDPHLALDGLPFEPRMALSDGADGLACIRRIVAGAVDFLVPGGFLFFEHGYDQGSVSRDLLLDKGFGNVATWSDLAGIDRVSGGILI